MFETIQLSPELKNRIKMEEHYYVQLLKANGYINDKTEGSTDGAKIENSIWKLFSKTKANTYGWDEKNIDVLLEELADDLLFKLSRPGVNSGQVDMYKQLSDAVEGIQKTTNKKIQEIMKDQTKTESQKIENKVQIQIGSGRELMAIDKLLEGWFAANGLGDNQKHTNNNFKSFKDYNDDLNNVKAMVVDISIEFKNMVFDYNNTGTFRNNMELDIKSSVDRFHVIDADIQQTLSKEKEAIKDIFKAGIKNDIPPIEIPKALKKILATAAIEWKLKQDIPVFIGIGEKGGVKALSCSHFVENIENKDGMLDVDYTKNRLSKTGIVSAQEAIDIYYKTLNKVSVFYGQK